MQGTEGRAGLQLSDFTSGAVPEGSLEEGSQSGALEASTGCLRLPGVSHALLRARVVKEEAGTERLRDVPCVIQPRAQVQEPSGRGVGGGGPQQQLNR